MRILIFCLVLLLIASCRRHETMQQSPNLRKVLVLYKAIGYQHVSRGDGVAMFAKYASAWNIVLTTTDSTSEFSGDNLIKYDVVVLLSTTGNIFSESEKLALQRYVQQGGAILGIHSASDSEYDWPWYGDLIGARFKDHPPIQSATCNVTIHETTQNIPHEWTRADEWYNYSYLRDDNNVVVTVDETTYTGGLHGANHPIAWYRYFDGGKVFYTAMGHTSESYKEPIFIQQISNAINWLTK